MWKPAVCTKDCPDTCGLLAQVEQGKITKIKADPDHPFTQGFICRKAKFFPDHVHNENRILTPLKRTGPKGAGQFEPVSWDEALDTIVEQIQTVVKTHGPQAILPYFYAGHMGIIHRNAGQPFFHKLGASKLLLTICGPAAGEGFKATLGSGPSTDLESCVDSNFIIIWGSNTLTTNVHAWPFFLKARKKGARIVVIDPYRTTTAKKADCHLMIKPGTDAALALGIMNVLIRENLVNKTFIDQWTVGYEQLVLRAAEYPLEKTAETCGVSTREIEKLALSYGSAKAPFIRTGWGPARQLRGAMAMRTIACLPALVGAFDTPGSGITRSLGGWPSDITRLTRPDLCPEGTRTINMVELGNALTQVNDPPVKLFYNFMSNPAAVAPHSALVHQGLAREDLFVVVHELFMTDTARMADIILPSASFLEMTDIYRSYGHNYIRMARPVIPPVGQSRTNLAIFQELAKRMGFTEEVFHLTEDYFIQGFLEQPHPSLEGVDINALMQGKTVRLNITSNPYTKGFNTPSGKVEFFSQAWQDKGLDPLPCGQVWRDAQDHTTYPLELMTPPHPLFLNSAFNEIEKIKTLAGRPTLLIHPDDAAARHIAQDTPVRVFNARGECRLDAKITTDTRPGLVVAEGLHWPQFMDQGKGINQLTSQRLTDQGETCAFHCSRVEVMP
nr:molybdopterin oxidoreductase family protein [uncultured Desulfobacter sp.]